MKRQVLNVLLMMEWLVSAAQSSAVQYTVHFDHVGTEKGLSFSSVNCLLQDQRGFIWVSTANGLNRYDGNTFTVYRHDRSNQNSVVSNDVRSLAEDARGNIWIGTAGGVSVLNPYHEQFTTYIHRDDDSTSLSADYINHVYADKNKTIWTGNP